MRTSARASGIARVCARIRLSPICDRCISSTPNYSTNCAPRALGLGRASSARTSRRQDLICWRCLTGSRLHVGTTAVVEITGLRNPCIQIDKFQKGLLAATLDQDAEGNPIRKAGVMSLVISAGDVRPGDRIVPEMPAEPHQPLLPV